MDRTLKAENTLLAFLEFPGYSLLNRNFESLLSHSLMGGNFYTESCNITSLNLISLHKHHDIGIDHICIGNMLPGKFLGGKKMVILSVSESQSLS